MMKRTEGNERRRIGVALDFLLERPDNAASVAIDVELQVRDEAKDKRNEDQQLRYGLGRVHRPHSRNLQTWCHSGQEPTALPAASTYAAACPQ